MQQVTTRAIVHAQHNDDEDDVFYASHNHIVVTFEGNIAAGKSSLLRALESKYTNAAIEWEPVDQWVNDEGRDLLALYYSNPYKYGLEFELKVLATMANRSFASRCSTANFILEERSSDAGMNVFCKYMTDMCFLTAEQHHVIREAAGVYDSMLNILRPVYKRYIIYFRCEPQTAFDRNEQRQGSAHNKNIPLEVFQAVHKAYDRWLCKRVTNTSNGPARVFIIESSDSSTLEQSKAEVERVLEAIAEETGVRLKSRNADDVIVKSSRKLESWE